MALIFLGHLLNCIYRIKKAGKVYHVMDGLDNPGCNNNTYIILLDTHMVYE